MVVLKQLIEAGVLRGVIDRTYRLAEIAEAHRYVELGSKAGDVIVTIPSRGWRSLRRAART